MVKNKNKVIIYNFIGTVILQGINFFSVPFFSRSLGVTNYGIYAVYCTWVSVMATIFPLCINATLSVARTKIAINEQNQYQSSILFLGTLSHIIFSIGTLLFVSSISKVAGLGAVLIIFSLFHSYGEMCSNFLNSKFIYEFKADNNMILSIGTVVASVILSFILIYLMPVKDNYWALIIGKGIIYAFVGVITFVIIIRKGKTYFNLTYWKFCLPLSIPVIFHSLSNLILNQSDRVMLQGMIGNGAVGIYSLAYSFGSILQIIWSALNNSWVAFYYDFLHLNKFEEMYKHTKNYLRLFTIISIGFLYLFPEIYRVFASREYWTGIDLIPIFVIGFYMIFLYSFEINYEFYKQKSCYAAIATVSASVVNVVMNYFFIRVVGVIGAAAASSLAYILQFIFHYIDAKYLIKGDGFPFNITFFAPYIIAFFIGLSTYYLIKEQWIIRWVIAIVLGLYEVKCIYKDKAIF